MDKFMWKPGDVVVAQCSTCVELAQRILEASSADEHANAEEAFERHNSAHNLNEYASVQQVGD